MEERQRGGMTSLRNTIKGIRWATVLKVFAAVVGAVLTVAVVIFLLWIMAGISEESISSRSVDVDISLSNEMTESEKVRELRSVCSEYCKDKDLKEIVIHFEGGDSIKSATGEVRYRFEKYIDDSKEGGNISAADIYYDANGELVYKIDEFAGAGRAHALPNEVLTEETLNVSVKDVVGSVISYCEENGFSVDADSSLAIYISNGNATCMLRSSDPSKSALHLKLSLPEPALISFETK